MSGWAWAFFAAVAWLLGRFLWTYRAKLPRLGRWIPRRVVCVFRGHRWGHGMTARVNPDTLVSRFVSFGYRCLRCGRYRHIELHSEAAVAAQEKGSSE